MYNNLNLKSKFFSLLIYKKSHGGDAVSEVKGVVVEVGQMDGNSMFVCYSGMVIEGESGGSNTISESGGVVVEGWQ